MPKCVCVFLDKKPWQKKKNLFFFFLPEIDNNVIYLSEDYEEKVPLWEYQQQMSSSESNTKVVSSNFQIYNFKISF